MRVGEPMFGFFLLIIYIRSVQNLPIFLTHTGGVGAHIFISAKNLVIRTSLGLNFILAAYFTSFLL